ncbi:PHP domain protein [Natrialba magadii ATCC 43099]|uniref:PHP domain protein n=1 Tax=Natrialba magadii (strain ATCC 43099 / DSM 3394 / CCM 3739 / CIP 104546 / IAM 13178 / JCM 8861 / NBRC 102185 / NCIMB 2190 / MS3) TaxID=547559 RepID=D3SVH0_NATMM|nr:PHP domain-containing protein [Natrialba magadii]ADD05578.1 PHP domain protein [Natrialba magadii ATCC 43099]ELY30007.1 PHP domain-containing protein [Natrialba magadii ATCC 43099]
MTPLPFTIDFHVHSDDSYDGHEPIELILEHATDIGLDGVVITDHDEIGESLRAAELAPEYGLIGIPGVEVSTRHGHLLAIGVEERPDPGRPFMDTVETVREFGGIAIVPHPFQRSRHGVRKRHIKDADAIETYNSMLFTGYRNRRARTFARRRGYPEIGASDAHYLPNVGKAYTEILVTPKPAGNTPSKAEIDGDDLVDAILEGRTQIRGKRTPVHKSTVQYAKGAVRKSAYMLTSRAPLVPTVPASMNRSR